MKYTTIQTKQDMTTDEAKRKNGSVDLIDSYYDLSMRDKNNISFILKF